MKARPSLSIVVALATAGVMLCCTLADAQTWSSPQFVANGSSVAVATNGSTSAVLFTPLSGGLQASVKSGANWQAPVTLTTAGATGNIAVAPNGDVFGGVEFSYDQYLHPSRGAGKILFGGTVGKYHYDFSECLRERFESRTAGDWI